MTYSEMTPADQKRVRTEMIVQAQKLLREAGYGRARVRFEARRMVDMALASERKANGSQQEHVTN